MTRILNILRIAAVSTLVLTAMPGCFTGIERTPKIKDTTSSKNKTALTPEQTLLTDIEPQKLRDWLPGKPFVITPGRLSVAYTPSSETANLNVGDTLRYVGTRTNIRLSGDSITEIILQTPSLSELITIIESPVTAIQDTPLSLPFTVDADIVGQVRNILKSKTVWTLRPGKDGKRYQKTKIEDVKVGYADFPFMVITPSDSLLMILRSKSTSARTFDNLFSLSDPRKSYPQISDKNWELISSGKIALEMTREECRLALGAPSEIEREAAYSGLYERWTYEDGKYLIFADGLLTRFRL